MTDKETYSELSRKRAKEANAHRVEQLVDLVERYTRTERHLEQNLGACELDDVKHVLKVQEEREHEIENLKNIIAYGVHDQVSEIKNLSRNYSFSGNYIDHHSGRMDEETLKKTEEKQEHRKHQLEILEEKHKLY